MYIPLTSNPDMFIISPLRVVMIAETLCQNVSLLDLDHFECKQIRIKILKVDTPKLKYHTLF